MLTETKHMMYGNTDIQKSHSVILQIKKYS